MHALRRPHRLRLRRPVRQARARRRAARRPSRDVWTGETAIGAAAGPERRRLEVLRRLPAEAAAQEGADAAAADARRGPAALAPVRRVHGRLQHLLQPGVLRAGNGHHDDAAGRDAGFRSLHARHRRGRPVARPRGLLQLRRGVPPQARRGDVRVHQDASSRTSISTRARTAWRSPRTGPGASSIPASTR